MSFSSAELKRNNLQDDLTDLLVISDLEDPLTFWGTWAYYATSFIDLFLLPS